MSYLVLARKYRPPTFADVIGQPEIVDKLKTALASGRTGHAYLFCGPRGVGKTTCARILAREFNKNAAHDQSMFDLGLPNDFDLIEIDGASNNGVDEIRTLRDNAQLMPMGGGVKVYIIDEVHMLSPGAFNALLKTLEEPPPYVKFIFATTDPNKLPLTVVSRCQRFDFRRIPLEQMVAYLKDLCVKEHFIADDDSLYAIAKASQGSMRDALSVLDQLSSTSSGKINMAEVNAMLGVVEIDRLFSLAEALIRRDCAASLRVLADIVSKGKDIKQLSRDLITFFRNLMIMKVGGTQLQDLIDYSASYKKMLHSLAGLSQMEDILFIIDKLVESNTTARIIDMPQLALEIAFARIAVIQTAAVPQPVPTALKSAPIQISAPVPVAAKPLSAPEKKIPVPPVLNNRGTLINEPVQIDQPEASSSQLTLSMIQADWNTFTHAVCQQSMPAGTYLQEGRPLKFDGHKLAIGFCQDHEFHKEFLEAPANLNLVAAAFASVFRQDIAINIILTEGTPQQNSEAAVNDVLAIFGGKVVNEWDSNDGLSKSY